MGSASVQSPSVLKNRLKCPDYATMRNRLTAGLYGVGDIVQITSNIGGVGTIKSGNNNDGGITIGDGALYWKRGTNNTVRSDWYTSGGDDDDIQAAVDAANGRRLVVPNSDSRTITTQITLPDDIILDIKGTMTLTGDEDFWFYADAPTRLVIENFIGNVTTAFGSRVNLNRVIRADNPVYMEIKRAKITGASTAIHALEGDTFVCNNVELVEVEGTAPQYGYGVNSSCKRTHINNLIAENSDTTRGRHGIYINGDVWEFVSITNVKFKNYNRNPIQITNTGTNNKCVAFVDNAEFEACNIAPLTTETGCINVGASSTDNAELKLIVPNVSGDDIAGTLIGSTYSHLKARIGKVNARNLRAAANASTPLVYFRFGTDQSVDSIHVDELATDWQAALSIRNATDFRFKDIYVGGSGGDQAARFRDSSVEIGHITTAGIDKTFESGATQTYNALQQKFIYGGAIPTSGAFNRGDIVWDTTPSAGGNMGWVATAYITDASVDNSAFKTFGAIEI